MGIDLYTKRPDWREGSTCVVMVCNTEDKAFGPVFTVEGDRDEATAFVREFIYHLRREHEDPRRMAYHTIESLWWDFEEEEDST